MPKIIDHDQRRREIVEVAKKLIVEGGFEAATMRSIVTAAGFANGALKHYFPSKDSIIAATFESVLAETGERLAALDTTQSPAEQLRGFLLATLPMEPHEIASGRILLALWDHSVANPALADRYRELLTDWRVQLTQRIAAVRDRGEPADAPAVGLLADEVISVAIGATVTSLMYPPGELVARHRAYVDSFVERVAGAA
ncbi:TetR/AcrR family transcriptional regulator [Blastococcus sp. SYSU D00820]